MKTLLIMAGGTGGHVMPALAVAHALQAKGVKIVWLGTRKGIEFDLVPKNGFELKLIQVSGLRGKGFVRKLIAPFVLIKAAFEAGAIILSVKTSAILGMGGFVSGPGGLVGRLLRKPLILHEQNAIAGTTNKLLAPFAQHVLTGFDHVKALDHARHVGNPVKPEITAILPPEKRLNKRQTTFNILVVGGSQGALIFNEKLPQMLEALQEKLGKLLNLKVHHQCGKNKKAAVSMLYKQSTLDEEVIEVAEFIDDMASAYAWSDVVICRSGAMTVAEISAAGAVALFVPFPYAIDDHQFYNAKAMSESGAAFCIRQAAFLQGAWLQTLADLANDRQQLVKVAQKARSMAKPDATQKVADICWDVMEAQHA